ncbi:MAG TPA: RraA family protein [Firmicutes bacterium]|nr:RraA family protein [Bacillota bacterium]
MLTWKDDRELFQIIRRHLYSAVVGDILDKMGYTHQFLPARIQPLRPDMILAGRAMPALEADAVGGQGRHNEVLKKSFGLMLEALDDLKEDEIYICTGASPTYALWGELMCTRAKMLGAAGAVMNGYSRDTKGILELDFPVFSYGRYAQDQAPRGMVVDYRVPIEIEGVRIRPGDILVGDCDGVVAVPQEAETEVIRQAYEKAMGENLVRKAIQQGMSAREAFEKYGIM